MIHEPQLNLLLNGIIAKLTIEKCLSTLDSNTYVIKQDLAGLYETDTSS